MFFFLWSCIFFTASNWYFMLLLTVCFQIFLFCLLSFCGNTTDFIHCTDLHPAIFLLRTECLCLLPKYQDGNGDGPLGGKQVRWGMRMGVSAWDSCPYEKTHQRAYSLSLPATWGDDKEGSKPSPRTEFAWILWLPSLQNCKSKTFC